MARPCQAPIEHRTFEIGLAPQDGDLARVCDEIDDFTVADDAKPVDDEMLRGRIPGPLVRAENGESVRREDLRDASHIVVVAVGRKKSLVVAKDELKYAFGRTWPETWTRNNPSLIRDNVFGFFPFHGGPGYASFPSGHTATICAVMTVFWICYPRWRPLYALAMAGVAIGLVGADFHFLSDVIAGGFLGLSVGWITVALWEIGTRQVRGDKATDGGSAALKTDL